MHDTNMSFTFVYDIRRVTDLRKAILYARHQLMQEAFQQNYNIMILEGYAYSRLLITNGNELTFEGSGIVDGASRSCARARSIALKWSTVGDPPMPWAKSTRYRHCPSPEYSTTARKNFINACPRRTRCLMGVS